MGRAGRRTAVLSTVALAVGAGVGVGTVFDAPAAQAAELPAFDSCTAFQHWVTKAKAEEARHPRVMAVDGTLPNEEGMALRAPVPQTAGAAGTAEKTTVTS